MRSTILITTTDNIKDGAVIDNSKIQKQVHDSCMDVFTFENQKNGKQREDNLMNVSLYDDLIIKDENKFKILHMLSK